MQHHIFLSYSRRDDDIMQQVKTDFLAAGLSVWTDEGIEPGTRSWKLAIENAIREAGCLVCLLSPDAARSEWVRAELDFADLQNKPVFLILARGDEKSAIPFGYASFQWVDIRDSARYDTALARLMGAIQKQLGIVDDSSMQPGQTPYGPLGLPLLQQLPKVAVYAPEMRGPGLHTGPPDVAAILPPPFAWCEIPAGKVTLSYVRGVTTTPAPVQEVGPFWIGKYPITEGQFERFVDAADGYRDARWWAFSDEAAAWHQAHREPEWRPPIEEYDLARMPRRNLNAYDVQAFCQWLMAQTGADGWEIRVPTAEEWHRAVQGDAESLDVFPKALRDQPVTASVETVSPFGVMHLDSSMEWWVKDLSSGPVAKKPRSGPGLSFIRSSILPSLYQFRLVAVLQDDAG